MSKIDEATVIATVRNLHKYGHSYASILKHLGLTALPEGWELRIIRHDLEPEPTAERAAASDRESRAQRVAAHVQQFLPARQKTD
jgi:hypothetical protein